MPRRTTHLHSTFGGNLTDMKPLSVILARFLLGLRRPSKRENLSRLGARGEAPASLTIRDATVADIPELAQLHVTTWNATYAGLLMRGPSVAIRAQQWHEAFART